ncbi:MAG: hypothetical protein ACOC93_04120, partial [Planctomycetota bacterium]
GLARHVVGELFQAEGRWQRAMQRVSSVAERQDLVLVVAALLAELPTRQVRRLVRRWGASNELRDAVIWLGGNLHRWREVPEMSLATFKRLLAEPHFHRLLELWAFEERRATNGTVHTNRAARRAEEIPPESASPSPLVTGNDLMQMGLPQGPAIGQILQQLYTAQLNEELTDRRQALARAQHLTERHLHK